MFDVVSKNLYYIISYFGELVNNAQPYTDITKSRPRTRGFEGKSRPKRSGFEF